MARTKFETATLSALVDGTASYRIGFLIEDDNFEFVDFSDAGVSGDVNLLADHGDIETVAERSGRQFSMNPTFVVLRNPAGFWFKPLPTTLTTVNGNTAVWADTATRIGMNAIKGRRGRLVCRVEMPMHTMRAGAVEDIVLGTFICGKMRGRIADNVLTLELNSMSSLLREATAENVRDGMSWYRDTSISQQIRRLIETEYSLTKFNSGNIPDTYEIPTAIRIPTPGGERFPSMFGRPPQWDGSTWNDERTKIGRALCCYTYNTGTITLTHGSTTVEGAGGMDWAKALRPNDCFEVNSSTSGASGVYEISSVTDADTAELVRPYLGPTESGLVYGVSRLYVGLDNEVWEYFPGSDKWAEVQQKDDSGWGIPSGAHVRRLWYNTTYDASSGASRRFIWGLAWEDPENSAVDSDNDFSDAVALYPFYIDDASVGSDRLHCTQSDGLDCRPGDFTFRRGDIAEKGRMGSRGSYAYMAVAGNYSRSGENVAVPFSQDIFRGDRETDNNYVFNNTGVSGTQSPLDGLAEYSNAATYIHTIRHDVPFGSPEGYRFTLSWTPAGAGVDNSLVIRWSLGCHGLAVYNENYKTHGGILISDDAGVTIGAQGRVRHRVFDCNNDQWDTLQYVRDSASGYLEMYDIDDIGDELGPYPLFPTAACADDSTTDPVVFIAYNLFPSHLHVVHRSPSLAIVEGDGLGECLIFRSIMEETNSGVAGGLSTWTIDNVPYNGAGGTLTGVQITRSSGDYVPRRGDLIRIDDSTPANEEYHRIKSVAYTSGSSYTVTFASTRGAHDYQSGTVNYLQECVFHDAPYGDVAIADDSGGADYNDKVDAGQPGQNNPKKLTYDNTGAEYTITMLSAGLKVRLVGDDWTINAAEAENDNSGAGVDSTLVISAGTIYPAPGMVVRIEDSVGGNVAWRVVDSFTAGGVIEFTANTLAADYQGGVLQLHPDDNYEEHTVASKAGLVITFQDDLGFYDWNDGHIRTWPTVGGAWNRPCVTVQEMLYNEYAGADRRLLLSWLDRRNILADVSTYGESTGSKYNLGCVDTSNWLTSSDAAKGLLAWWPNLNSTDLVLPGMSSSKNAFRGLVLGSVADNGENGTGTIPDSDTFDIYDDQAGDDYNDKSTEQGASNLTKWNINNGTDVPAVHDVGYISDSGGANKFFVTVLVVVDNGGGAYTLTVTPAESAFANYIGGSFILNALGDKSGAPGNTDMDKLVVEGYPAANTSVLDEPDYVRIIPTSGSSQETRVSDVTASTGSKLAIEFEDSLSAINWEGASLFVQRRDVYCYSMGKGRIYRIRCDVDGEYDVEMVHPGYRMASKDTFLASNMVVDHATRGAYDDATEAYTADQDVIYAISAPFWPRETQCTLNSVSSRGQYALCKMDHYVADRIHIADYTKLDKHTVLGLFAEIADCVTGFDEYGDFYFLERPARVQQMDSESYGLYYDSIPDTSDTTKWIRVVDGSWDDGTEEVANEITLIPYRAELGQAKAEVVLRTREADHYIPGISSVPFAKLAIQQEDELAKEITLVCVQEGSVFHNNQATHREDNRHLRFKWLIRYPRISSTFSAAYSSGQTVYVSNLFGGPDNPSGVHAADWAVVTKSDGSEEYRKVDSVSVSAGTISLPSGEEFTDDYNVGDTIEFLRMPSRFDVTNDQEVRSGWSDEGITKLTESINASEAAGIELDNVRCVDKGSILRVENEEMLVISKDDDAGEVDVYDAAGESLSGAGARVSIGGTVNVAHDGSGTAIPVQAYFAPGIHPGTSDAVAGYDREKPHAIGDTKITLAFEWPNRDSSDAYLNEGRRGGRSKTTSDQDPPGDGPAEYYEEPKFTGEFLEGDRIDIACPGLSAKRQSKPIVKVSTASKKMYGSLPYKGDLDNRFINLVLGECVASRLLSDLKDPHRSYSLDLPFVPFVRSIFHNKTTLAAFFSKAHLPLFRLHKDLGYFTKVSHKPKLGRTVVSIRSVLSQ